MHCKSGVEYWKLPAWAPNEMLMQNRQLFSQNQQILSIVSKIGKKLIIWTNFMFIKKILFLETKNKVTTCITSVWVRFRIPPLSF